MLLLADLARINRNDIEVILTWNLENENCVLDPSSFPFEILSIANSVPKGFAANHNAAFRHASGENFVLLNPDIRLPMDPFPVLLSLLETTENIICAPTILNSHLQIEDSARFFPSPLGLMKKAVAKATGVRLKPHRVLRKDSLLYPDWIAGMFLVVPYPIYSALGGLSERYFLYYEDVDFCARARLRGFNIIVDTNVFAIHDARRQSHRNLRFLSWHLTSALKFFVSRAYLSLVLKNFLKILKK